MFATRSSVFGAIILFSALPLTAQQISSPPQRKFEEVKELLRELAELNALIKDAEEAQQIAAREEAQKRGDKANPKREQNLPQNNQPAAEAADPLRGMTPATTVERGSLTDNAAAVELKKKRQWAVNHMKKGQATWNHEKLLAINSDARDSYEAERFWFASEMLPSRFVRLTPASFGNKEWGPEGKVIDTSESQIIIFRVVYKDEKDGNKIKIPEGGEGWFYIGFNDIARILDPEGNPYGISHSGELFKEARPDNSIKVIEGIIDKIGAKFMSK